MPNPSEIERRGTPSGAVSRYVVGLFVALSLSLAAWAPVEEPLPLAAMESRSSDWPAVRRMHLRAFPACEVCGSRTEPQVHHVTPFHVDASRELDPSNLITLCRTHHFCVGHGGSWRAFSRTVREDAAMIRKILERIRKEREE